MPELSEVFNQSLDLPSFICFNSRKVKVASTCTIYPMRGLKRLLDNIKLKDPTATHVRFLIDNSFNLWLAEEGPPNKVIPSHQQMTGEQGTQARCVTAGNIVFSKDMRFIESVNHKSGDFRPSFDSMKWLLALLVMNEQLLLEQDILLPPRFFIEKLTSAGGLENTFEIGHDELIAWVHDIFSPEQLGRLTSQPLTEKTVYYAPPAERAAQFSLPAPKFRRLFFEEGNVTAETDVSGSSSASMSGQLSPN